jgi:hypothetical protein
MRGPPTATLVRAASIWHHTSSYRARRCGSRQAGRLYRSFRGLLTHLATLTRNQVRFTGATTTVPMLAEPTSTQRDAFQLIGTPIPLTLK